MSWAAQWDEQEAREERRAELLTHAREHATLAGDALAAAEGRGLYDQTHALVSIAHSLEALVALKLREVE